MCVCVRVADDVRSQSGRRESLRQLSSGSRDVTSCTAVELQRQVTAPRSHVVTDENYYRIVVQSCTTVSTIASEQADSIYADYFSGPASAIGPVCVCVCVS